MSSVQVEPGLSPEVTKGLKPKLLVAIQRVPAKIRLLTVTEGVGKHRFLDQVTPSAEYRTALLPEAAAATR